MRTPSSPRRRWPWWLGGSLLLLMGLLVSAWLAGPRLACAALGSHLPLDLGHGYRLTQAATVAPAGVAQTTLRLPPDRARRLANSLPRVWLPPGWPRAGATLVGIGHLPRDEVAYGWRLAVAQQVGPTLDIHLTPAEADDLLAPYRRLPIDRERDLFMTWQVSEATVRDADPPGEASDHRCLRIDASGEMRLAWHDRTWRIAVRHLVAHLDWTFTPIAGGLRPECRLSIDSADAALPSLPGMRDGRTVWDRVERGANRSLAKHLAKRVWPAGTPIDAVVDGRIGSDPAASVAAR